MLSSQVAQKYLPRLGPVPLQILSPRAVVIPVKLPALDRGLPEEVSKDSDQSDSVGEVAEEPSPAPVPRTTTTTVSARPEPSSTADHQSGEGGGLDGTFGGGSLLMPSGFESALSLDEMDSRKRSDIGVILNLLKFDSEPPSRRRSGPVREPGLGPVPSGQSLPAPSGATTEP